MNQLVKIFKVIVTASTLVVCTTALADSECTKDSTATECLPKLNGYTLEIPPELTQFMDTIIVTAQRVIDTDRDYIQNVIDTQSPTFQSLADLIWGMFPSINIGLTVKGARDSALSNFTLSCVKTTKVTKANGTVEEVRQSQITYQADQLARCNEEVNNSIDTVSTVFAPWKGWIKSGVNSMCINKVAIEIATAPGFDSVPSCPATP
jgi:hypothetical protein